jgi:hypothetical protein
MYRPRRHSIAFQLEHRTFRLRSPRTGEVLALAADLRALETEVAPGIPPDMCERLLRTVLRRTRFESRLPDWLNRWRFLRLARRQPDSIQVRLAVQLQAHLLLAVGEFQRAAQAEVRRLSGQVARELWGEGLE